MKRRYVAQPRPKRPEPGYRVFEAGWCGPVSQPEEAVSLSRTGSASTDMARSGNRAGYPPSVGATLRDRQPGRFRSKPGGPTTDDASRMRKKPVDLARIWKDKQRLSKARRLDRPGYCYFGHYTAAPIWFVHEYHERDLYLCKRCVEEIKRAARMRDSRYR